MDMGMGAGAGMELGTRIRRARLALGLAGALVGCLVSPAGATNQVTLTIVPGPLSVSVSGLSPLTVDIAPNEQTQTAMVVLVVDDRTGSGNGWHVTLESSRWVANGPDHGDDIPATDVVLTAVGAATATAGQLVAATGGPMPPPSGATGSLDVARTVLQANRGFGQGAYVQTLAISRTLPDNRQAGAYIGALTVSITSGP